MSDDIIARLRESDGGYFVRKLLTEAADEIERLRQEVKECEDLLDEYRRIESDRVRAECWERE